MLSIAALAGCANSNENNELGKAAASGAFRKIPVSREIYSDIRTPVETLKVLQGVSSHCYMDELKVGHETLKQRKDGVSYFVVKGRIKNLGPDESMVGWGFPRGIDTSFVFNDQYKVEGEPTAVSNLGFEPSIKPLVDTGFWSVAEVSSDFKEQFENCKMTLNVNREQEYKDGSLQWTGDEEVVSSYVLSI